MARSYLLVPHQDPPATCPPRASLDGAELGAERPVMAGHRLELALRVFSELMEREREAPSHSAPHLF